jgi:putative copper resistance protein D
VQIDAWDFAAVALKTVTYAATLAAAGGTAFVVLNGPTLSAAHERRARRWLGACVGLALLASVVRIGVLTGSMGGDVGSMFDGALAHMVLQAGEGRATGLRVIGLLTIAIALAGPHRLVNLALGGAVIASTSFAWTGHVWAASQIAAPALLSLHLVGLAYWLGALVPLAIATREEDLQRLAVVVHSFGVVAVVVVAALVAAGALVLALLLSAPSELWTTEYGRLVTAKLGFVTCLLGVASFNKLRLTPRLRALDRAALTVLRRSIRVEIGLGLIILLVTAALTTLVGPTTVEQAVGGGAADQPQLRAAFGST